MSCLDFSKPGSREALEARFWSRVTTGAADECWVWNGPHNGSGYSQISVAGRLRYVHRVSYELANGPISDGLCIDHTCHVRSCVNPGHLRAATYAQNAQNVSGLQRNNKSGFAGVSWNRGSKKWQAHVSVSGKPVNIGEYDTPEEAGAAVKARRLDLYTHNDLDRKEAA